MNPMPALLVVLLSHQSFPVREAADAGLERMGVLALPALEWGNRSTDPERASRSARMRDLLVTDYLIVPYIDSLPSWYPSQYLVIESYRAKARELGFWLNDCSNDWEMDTKAGELFVKAENPSPSLLAVMRQRTMFYRLYRKWEP